MSLISDANNTTSIPAAPEADASLVTNSPVYQTTGKPLSKEALYKAKLKHGIFQSPNKPNVGVNKEASNNAANLATKADLTVEAYKRLLSSDANKAAKSAAPAPVSGYQPVTSAQATSASAASLAATKAADKERVVSAESNAAAHSAINKPMTHYTSNSALKDIYEFDQRRASITSKASNSGGLKIKKILEGAATRANDRINERINPEKRNTLISSRSLGSDAAARAAAAAKGAAAKEYSAGDRFESNEQLKQLTSIEVLAAARQRADSILAGIDSNLRGKDYLANDDYNRAALAVAQARHAKRAEQKTDKVNVGGGLWLAPSDIDEIAQQLVAPVLAEINTKASEQRDTDRELATRTETVTRQEQEWKQLQKEKVENDKNFDREQRFKHERETIGEQRKFDVAKKQIDNEKGAIIADLKAKLEAKKAELEKKKVDLATALEDKDTANKAEIDELEKKNKTEIEAANKDKEAQLAPVLAELEGANAKHEEVSKNKQDTEESISDIRNKIETAKETLEAKASEKSEASEKLEAKQEEIKQLTEQQASKENELAVAKEELTSATAKAKEAETRAESKQGLINKELAEAEEARHKTEISLKQENLALLESERALAEFKGEKPPHVEQTKTTEAAPVSKATTLGPKLSRKKSLKERLFGKKANESKKEHFISEPKPVSKASTKPATNNLAEDTPDSEAELEPTFTGFSQGSVKDDSKKKRISFFKEVF